MLLELVTYYDSCKVVSHVLGSIQRKKSSTRSSLIGEWNKCSIIGWYFGIGWVVVRFFIFVNALFLINEFLGVMT